MQFLTQHFQCLECATSPLSRTSFLLSSGTVEEVANQVLQPGHGCFAVSCFSVKQSSIWPCDFQTLDLIPCSQTASLASWATWLHACAAWRWWRWGSGKGWIVTKTEGCRQSDFSPVRRLKNRCLELEHWGQMEPPCSCMDRIQCMDTILLTGTMTIPVKKQKKLFSSSSFSWTFNIFLYSHVKLQQQHHFSLLLTWGIDSVYSLRYWDIQEAHLWCYVPFAF